MRKTIIILCCAFLPWACGSQGGSGDDAAQDSVEDPDLVTDTAVETDVGDDPEPELDVEEESEGCPLDGDLGPGDHTIEMEFGGMARSYVVHVPEVYDPSVEHGLVLNLHGYTSNGVQQVLFSGMNIASDSLGYVALYPNGYENSWNGGACCGEAASADIDDVAFLSGVVDDISARLCIDRSRVYATGISNGGYMSHRLACEASDVFAAVAPVAGAMGIVGCSPARPMPLIAYNGTEDSLVSYDSGRAAVDQWVSINGCTGDPVRTDHGGSWCETWETCDSGVQVEFCSLDPMGHCWPGGSDVLCFDLIGPYNDDIIASEHMWEFFSAFPLP